MDPVLPYFTARVTPAVPLTWEVSDTLLGASQESGGITVPFPEPVEILGVHPSVTFAATPAGGGLIAATLDAIGVFVEGNSRTRITNRLRGDSGSALEGTSFVTLAALGTDVRWLRWVLKNEKPDVELKFRWKPDISGGAIYEDTIVSLAFFVRRLREGDND